MIDVIRNLFSAIVAITLLVVLLAACGSESSSSSGDISDRTINAVATTGMIGDTVANVGGDRVDITALMGPGVDPHLYKATAGDVSTLEDADIIFYNGLELEGRMTDILVRLSSKTPTVPVAAAIDESNLREPPEFDGKFDPHVWFDIQLWIPVVREIEAALADLDPDHADVYQENADAYIAELEALDEYAVEQFSSIPEDQRVLVTAHDAFGYLGVRYGLEVHGLQGISTASEASAADVQDLADLIVERKIKAIFIETSIPESTVQAVQEAVNARGGQVVIGGELFSDAMGEDGTEEGTYLGMFRHNVDTIVGALK